MSRKLEQRPLAPSPVDTPQFRRTLEYLMAQPCHEGNRVSELINGDRIFPAMLAAIAAARQTINLETFIYWSGRIGREFTELLTAKAAEGVHVRVLLDWIGSNEIDMEEIETMRRAGATVLRYHQPHWYQLDRINNRTHRKILVVDGRVGFTGGVGIADPWLGDAEASGRWRDTHFKVEGPAVASMQGAFMDNWLTSQDEVPLGPEDFPPLEPVGHLPVQVIKSSPRGGSESMHLMLMLAISAARESIRLASAYLIPDALASAALIDACRRGVKVSIIVPGPEIDHRIVRQSSMARWGPLLQAGIQIHEFMPTMFHCKLLIIDGRWVSVGSANFDNRSFRLNDEMNINIFDPDFARRQAEIFDHDLTRTRPVTFESWKRRPLRVKLVNHAANLVGRQL